MGRALGYFAEDDENDRPELNKCPDCGCFFASDNCPLCGKVCPDEYRAGNRKRVKHKKQRQKTYTYTPWYYSWWFIGIMLVLAPVVGIILMLTSPKSAKSKIIASAVVVVYILVTRLGAINTVLSIKDAYSYTHPKMTAEEVVRSAEEVSGQSIARLAESYDGCAVKISGVIHPDFTEKLIIRSFNHYFLVADDGTTVLIRDCRSGNEHLLDGDKVTVYGIGYGYGTLYDDYGNEVEAPIINLYDVIIK